MLQYHSLSAYDHQIFAKFGKKIPKPPSLVTNIDDFVANLKSRFSYHIWSNYIDFTQFHLAGGAVVICMLRNVHQQITSDLDFFYVGIRVKRILLIH